MAVKYESTLSQYKSSDKARESGIHSTSPYKGKWENYAHGYTPAELGQKAMTQLAAQGRKYYGANFSGDDELAALKAFGKTYLNATDYNPDLPGPTARYIENLNNPDDIYALLALASHNYWGVRGGYGNKTFDEPHSAWVKKVRRAIEEFDGFRDLVTALEEKGLSENQINQFLSSDKVAGKDVARLNLLADEIPDYSVEDFAGPKGFGVTADKDADGNTIGLEISDAAAAEGNAETPVEQAEEVLDTETFGDATNPDGLTAVEGTTDQFTDADGKTVYLGSDGKYRYGDGKEYISPDQTTVATEIQDDQASSDAAEEVVDEAVQQSGASATQAANIQTAYTGGTVNEGVANALGWIRTQAADGSVSYRDPRTDEEYTVGDDGILLDSGNQKAYTQGKVNFDEYDFGQQSQDIIDEFLYGAQVTPENASQYGYTYNEEDNTYTDASGEVFDTPPRTLGFQDYQSDLQGAAEEYTNQMTTLRSEYDQAYGAYDSELRPRLEQLDANTAALNQVAADANDQNYYNRLKNLYYQDAVEAIDRSARGQQETLNQAYANAGLDPSSPAYTAAIMDLEQKRSDASRSANRQAMIDSYSMGSQMLSNRTGALGAAQSGITTGINALGGLYDVKIKGLDVDKDMISTIYQGKQNEANVGISGLNTVASQQQNAVNANQAQFLKEIDLVSGLNSSSQAAAGNAAATAGQADFNATQDYWKGMDWMQTLIDNDFNWQATGAALKTQFPDYDFQGELDPKFYKQLFPNG